MAHSCHRYVLFLPSSKPDTGQLKLVAVKFCTWMYLCSDGKEAIELPFARLDE